MKHGKTYLDARQRLDREREYPPAEAIALVKQLKRAKFDESVEVHVRTGLNVRHADEQLRGTIALPNGLGKDVKVAVFAKGDKAREAEEAGADVVGAEDLAERIQEGFDERPLLENYAAVIDELIRAKPSAAKGRYIRSVTLSSTMGPGVKVDPSRTRDIVEEPVAA